MNNSLIDLLQCHKRTQNYTTCVFQVRYQSQQDNASDSLIDDFPTVD